jgi:hypothetical protein
VSISRRSAGRSGGPRVGRGSLDVDAGFGALWVTSASTDKRLTGSTSTPAGA